MPWHAVLCCAMLCHAMLCRAMQCTALLCLVWLCVARLDCAALHCAVLRCAVLCCALLCHALTGCAVLHRCFAVRLGWLHTLRWRCTTRRPRRSWSPMLLSTYLKTHQRQALTRHLFESMLDQDDRHSAQYALSDISMPAYIEWAHHCLLHALVVAQCNRLCKVMLQSHVAITCVHESCCCWCVCPTPLGPVPYVTMPNALCC